MCTLFIGLRDFLHVVHSGGRSRQIHCDYFCARKTHPASIQCKCCRQHETILWSRSEKDVSNTKSVRVWFLNSTEIRRTLPNGRFSSYFCRIQKSNSNLYIIGVFITKNMLQYQKIGQYDGRQMKISFNYMSNLIRYW